MHYEAATTMFHCKGAVLKIVCSAAFSPKIVFLLCDFVAYILLRHAPIRTN